MAKGFHLEWSIEGDKQISRVLNGLESRSKNFFIPLTQSAKLLKNLFHKDVFDTEGAVIGERWKRLSPYTVAQKARAGYSNPSKPLVATGRMRDSFFTVVSTTQAVIGNDAQYFKYHQSNRPRHHLPRRVMMKIDERRKEAIVKIFHKHLIGL